MTFDGYGNYEQDATTIKPGDVRNSDFMGLLSGWISRKDHLPREGQRVLVYLEPNHVHSVLREASLMQYEADIFTDGKFMRFNSIVSHWQPLPEPPSR